MAFFTRIRKLLRVSLNEALDASEDPVAALNYLVLELCEHLERARTAVAAAMAAERRLAEQAEEAGGAVRQWTDRARRALLHGAEDLAREALRRKRAADEMARYFAQALEEQHREVERLRAALAYLERRLQEARGVRAKLLARVATARAQQVVTRTLRQTVGDGAFEEFDRLAARIETAQYREQALAELTIGGSDDAFVLAEQDLLVEHELSLLKEELQGVVEPPALPQGDRT